MNYVHQTADSGVARFQLLDPVSWILYSQKVQTLADVLLIANLLDEVNVKAHSNLTFKHVDPQDD